MNTLKRYLIAASVAGILCLGSCTTADIIDPDTGEPTGATTTSIAGVEVWSTDAEGTPTLSPVVEGGAAAAGGMLGGWGWLLAPLLGSIPWFAEKRPRKKLWEGAKALVRGRTREAFDSVYAAVGLDHSEPDIATAFMKIRAKGIKEGVLDPATGLPWQYVKAAAEIPPSLLAEPGAPVPPPAPKKK